MPYHKNLEHPKPRQNRSLATGTTPALLVVENHTIVEYAFPCWYQELHPPIRAHLHCKDWHDHVGEPSPHHPDHSCQPYDEFAAWWTEAHEIDKRYPNYHNSPYQLRHAHRRLIDMRGLVPIHLKAEGYNKVDVLCDAKEGRVTFEGRIDEYRDHIIRLTITTEADNSEVEDFKFLVTLGGMFKESPKAAERPMKDIALRGILRVLPNMYSTLEQV